MGGDNHSVMSSRVPNSHEQTLARPFPSRRKKSTLPVATTHRVTAAESLIGALWPERSSSNVVPAGGLYARSRIAHSPRAMSQAFALTNSTRQVKNALNVDANPNRTQELSGWRPTGRPPEWRAVEPRLQDRWGRAGRSLGSPPLHR